MFKKKLPVVLIIFFFLASVAAGYLYLKLNLRGQPKPGYCKILERKYCKKAVAMIHPLAQNGEKFLVFDLPEGTPIFAPEDGYLSRPSYIAFEPGDNPQLYPGATLFVSSDPDINLAESSYIFINLNDTSISDNPTPPQSVQKSDVIGHVSGKAITQVRGYNFAVMRTKYSLDENNRRIYQDGSDILFKIFRVK